METETKKCSHCQSDIPVNAKKCSHCQTDLRNWMNRHPFLTGLGLLVVISIFLGNYGSRQINTAISNQSSQPTLEILSVSTKVVEKNSVWWKYSWVFSVKNHTDRDMVVNADLNWQDKEGFVVESSTEYGLSIPANSEQTFSDYKLINTQIAPTVNGIIAKIK